MGSRQGRSGEPTALGCLFAPGLALLVLGLLPGGGRHGNTAFAVLGVGALLLALLLVFLQAILPKPPEPPEPLNDPPEG